MTLSLLKNIERLVNELLCLDEENLERLSGLDGKNIKIEISESNLVMYLNLTRQGVEINPVSETPADVTIRASTVTYLQLAMRSKGGYTVSPGEMEIIGDVGLAQQFQSIIKELEIDWEEYISQWCGDYMAHKTGNFFRGLHNYIKETGEMISMDISEYLRYEKGQLPDQSEVNEFILAVDNIRNDVERLQQRLTRIDKHLFSGSS